MGPCFNDTLLALRILRSTLNFWRIRTPLVMTMKMMFVVLIIGINVTLMTVLTGCGGNVVCDRCSCFGVRDKFRGFVG